MNYKKQFSGLLSVIVIITIIFSTFYTASGFEVNAAMNIIKSYSPKNDTVYNSAQTVKLKVKAKKGSKVTASFNGKTITLKAGTKVADGFVTYTKAYTFPTYTAKDVNLGNIVFRATYKGKSQTVKSGNIICKKYVVQKKSDKSATPNGDNYINVGSGRIAEIVSYEAETFNPRSTNDYSRPTNNYLPKGTVDYCSQTYYYHKDPSDYDKKYVLLRCGRQVYSYRKNKPTNQKVVVTKEYIGELPDHNEISLEYLVTGSSHTTLKIGSFWKAPFYFDIKPQKYKNPKYQDYRIDDFTAKYIDITFCYATVLEGEIEIPSDNPLFKKAKIIRNLTNDKKKTLDYTLRLYLKKAGGFYGWECSYAADGSLIFKFLNPHQVTKANNKYGVDLNNAKILIDVGHGGRDGGALGFSRNQTEAKRNLILAKKLRKELKSIGAKVYMTRTDNSLSTNDDKIKQLKSLKPDYCIAIHHDSSYSSSPNGFGAFYTHPFSKNAAKLVMKYTKKSGVYRKSELKCHFYYMARSSYCPVVLTENGFMSNYSDYKKIISDSANNKKATALTKAIAQYFLSIQ